MGQRLHAISVAACLIALQASFFLGCYKSESTLVVDREIPKPFLEMVSLVRYPAPGEQLSIAPQNMELFPPFNPDTLRYSARVPKGRIALFPVAQARGTGISAAYNGTPLFAINVAGANGYGLDLEVSGSLTVSLKNPASGAIRTYQIDLTMLPDPAFADHDDSLALSAMALQQVFYFRTARGWSNTKLDAVFHPDRIINSVSNKKGDSVRFVVQPLSPKATMTISINGNHMPLQNPIVSPVQITALMDTFLDFRTTISHPLLGSSRTYSLFAYYPVPFLSNGWEELPSMRSDLKNALYSPIEFIDDENWYFASTWNPEVMITSDGGNTWRVSPTASKIHGLDFVDSKNGFVFGPEGKWQKTTDGGLNWESMNPAGNAPYEIYGISFPSSQVGYAIVSDTARHVVKTGDAGTTWGNVIRGIPDSALTGLNDVKFIDAKHGFLTGYKGIWQTRDAGANWKTVPLPTASQGTRFRLHPVPEESTIVIFEGYEAFQTRDDGMNWRRLATPPLEGISAIKFVNADTGCFMGTHINEGLSRTINCTQDGGHTWTAVLNSKLPLNVLESFPDGSWLAISPFGDILRRKK